MGEVNTTDFSAIYDNFFVRVTDDMYFEMTKLDTQRDLQNILIAALPKFEFPRFNIFDYTLGKEIETEDEETGETIIDWDGGFFNAALTTEEINILSLCMMEEWFRRQIATVENTREKFSGADFKFTSQANHLAKLKVMKDSTHTDNIHLQRIYKRRKLDSNGKLRSTMGQIMTTPKYGYTIGGVDYDD